MKRRLALAAALAALVLLAGAAVLLLAPRDPVAVAASRIRAGMTLDEVEAIMGGPGRPMRSLAMYSWPGERCYALVSFDENGRVRQAGTVRHGEPTLLDRVRAWLGLE